MAVSLDGANWLLLNASIDLRQQVLATPAMHPRGRGAIPPCGGVADANRVFDALEIRGVAGRFH